MRDITERLRDAAEDPMWAHHAEVSKRTLFKAADTIDALRAELVALKAQEPVATAVEGAAWGLWGEAGVCLIQRGTEDKQIAKKGGERLYRLSAAPTAQPVQESRSKRMAAAGFTPRDSRLTCDECGAKFTAQMAPLHECAQKHPVPVQAAPVSAEDALVTAAKSALHYMDSVGQMDMYPSEWQVAQALRAALAAKGAQDS
jgi:hypothetical protein